MNKTHYPISIEKFSLCIPFDEKNLIVPFALKSTNTFNFRIIVNLDKEQLEQKLNNIFNTISVLDFYNFLHNSKNLIEFEKTLTLKFDDITYNVNLIDFLNSLNNTISYIYSKFFYQINKGIKL